MNEIRTIIHQSCKLAYRLRGSGPPVLMIQGVNAHGDGWNRQVSGLEGHYACLTFDNRGMGGSDRGTEPITVPQMADDAIALLDAVGWESAHIVGHSLGGPVALHLALTNCHRVRSLAILCSFARGQDAGPLSWRLISAGLRMQLGTRAMKRRAFLELVVPPGRLSDRDTLATELAPLFGHDLAEQPPVVQDQMKAMRAFDATPRLGELSGFPTLVASAEHDPIAPPRLGRAMAEAIAGSRYVEWRGVSHGVILTDPDLVNAIMAEHFAAAESRRSGQTIDVRDDAEVRPDPAIPRSGGTMTDDHKTVLNDAYDLKRFVTAQDGVYERALAEIRDGQKRSHWMWFIFPQFDGLGTSPTAKRYAIKSRAEAEAYLAHPILGLRLMECAQAAAAIPEPATALDVFGSPDDMKLRSSATLFTYVSPSGNVFERVLKRFFLSKPDLATLRLLGEPPPAG